MIRGVWLAAAVCALTVQTAAQVAPTLLGRGGSGVAQGLRTTAGNAVDPFYPTASLGVPVPDDWGTYAQLHTVGATTGQALSYRNELRSTTGAVVTFDFLAVSSSMADTASVGIAAAKEISAEDFDDTATIAAWRMFFVRAGAGYTFRMRFDVGGDEVVYEQAGALIGTVYRMEVNYDLVADLFEWKIDDVVVATRSITGSNSQSIGTIVFGSIISSAGRNVTFALDRMRFIEVTDPLAVPTNVTVVLPANGATNVEVSATYACSGTGAETWEVRYGTTNPIVSAYVSAGSTGTLGPVSLLNNTLYYVQCRATNTSGSTASAVSSFTTIATTSTGTHPTLLINATRLNTWGLMRGDYLEDPTCTAQVTENERVGCNIYKAVYDSANAVVTTNDQHEGLEPALLAQITGNNAATYCLKAYNDSVTAGLLHYTDAAPAHADPNVNRELFTDWVLIYDWCYQSWNQTQRDAYLSKLNGLASGILAAPWYPNGWSCSDVDQQIGNYFGLAALYYSTKAYNPTIVSLWADDDIGGITATPLVCDPVSSLSKTARNQIAYYYADATADIKTNGPSVGGAWFQGTEYSSEAFLGVLGCEAVRTTEAADAPCAEIDTWVDDWAQYYTHRFTRDYQAIYQSADNQEPHTAWKNYFRIHESYHYLTLSGILPDTSIRQNMWRQFLNFRATNGSSLVFPANYPARGMMLANPYITASTDLTSVSNCYASTGYGLYTWNDSWTGVSSNASQFVTHFKPTTRGNDHFITYFGDIGLYRKGQFAITHPFSYAGVAGLTPLGTNTVEIEGLEPSPSRLVDVKGEQYQKPNGYTCGTDYLYVAGTSGGSFQPPVNIDGTVSVAAAAEHYVDEYTREVVYLSSTTKTVDTIYVVDRIAAKDPETLAGFTNYALLTPGATVWNPNSPSPGYQYFPARPRIQASPRWTSFLFQWINPGTPILTGNKTTWTLSDGQLAEDNWFTPDAVTVTLEDMDNLSYFNQSQTTTGERNRWRSKVEPNASADWNVLGRLISVRDAGVAAPVLTELSVTGTCLASLITRAGENDVVIVSNSAQGDLIPQANPTAAQATAVLATARYSKAKTCTIPWTQTTATAKVLILDLNPALAWTSNLDAAGAVAITEDSSGLEELSIANTGAHSLVVIGT